MQYKLPVEVLSSNGNVIITNKEVNINKGAQGEARKIDKEELKKKWEGKSVDIVITTKDNPHAIANCLESICSRTSKRIVPWTITVVDNASDEFTKEFLKRLVRNLESKAKVKINLIRMKKYTGYLPAMHIGYQETKGDWIVFLDQNISVTEGWLEGMLFAVTQNPRIAIVAPWTSKRIPPKPGSNYLDAAAINLEHNRLRAPDMSFPPSTVFMIDRKALKNVGGFDLESYGPGYGEIQDVCMRLAAKGRVCARAIASYVLDQSNRKSEVHEWMPNESAGYKRFITRWGDDARKLFKMKAGKDKAEESALLILKGQSKRPRIVFAFREAGLFGATLACAHIANGLVELGWNASIAWSTVVPGHNMNKIPMRFAPLVYQSPSLMIKNLRSELGPNDVVVAPIFNLVDDVARICSGKDFPMAVYFVQDDERKFRHKSGELYADPKEVEKSFGKIDRKISNSIWVEDMLKRLGHPSNRIAIGVDSLMFHPEEKPKDKVTVLVHCRHSTPRRGWPFIAKVLNEVAGKVQFELVTYDQEPPQGDLQVPWSGHLGVLSPSELARYMSSAHIMFEGSQLQGFGMQGLEAMASGCALLVTDNEGINTYGTDGHDCVIVPYGDVERATAVLIHLIKSKSDRKVLGSNARKTAENFDWRYIAAEWNRILRRWTKR